MSLSRRGEVDHALAAALAGVGLGDLRQRAVGIEARGVSAERDRERGDGAVVMDQAVEQRALRLGLLDAVADDDEGAGQNLEMFGIAADLLHAALDVGIEAFGRREVPPPVNTASAVSAASCRPASDAPACTITGQPCTGRAMLSGPRTDRYSPLWSSTCIFAGSK